MASYPNVNAATRYAREVVSGKIIACRYVRLTCQRHLDDIKKSKSKAYPYRFDKAKAERVCKFAQLLPHTKGKQFVGKLIVLEPWQKFILCCVFGWVYKSSGLRRFNEVYNEVARKNGKSAKTAGVGHYLFCADGEYGAEVYCGATTEKQAMEVFDPARLMAKKLPKLRKRFSIEVWAKKLTRTDGSKFEPVIGDPGDGASPSGALVDEYHEHADSSLYDTMLTGMGAREQGLMWVITTAGYNIDGPCYDMRERVVEMLEGEKDDHLFGIIFTIDTDDDWTSETALLKANPNAGVSVSLEYLKQQQQRAIKRARYVNTFKTKHLNVWVAGKEAFFNMEAWQSCKDTSLTPEQFKNDECYLGFDLARKLDMNSMARLYTRMIDGKRHYYSVAPMFYVPEDQIFNNDDKRLSEKFKAWAESGDISPTEGAEIDYRAISADAKDVHLETPVDESALDPSGAIALGHDLDDEGLNPITITQNFTNMSDPMKELEAAVLTGRFHHDGHPIMTWCIGNVVGKHLPGNDDVVRPIKQKAANKIDGAVSLIMAVGRAMLNEDTSSNYEDEDYGL
ncbi:terminase large subunit [Sansalvadorimonas verongulae]|uniref:terminase large subunit n=1 Tax=Sansalvadorimonas verongulae TaxID=2172824 RepID=UPI0012BCA2EA|nr:terminase TerL endonuclease subunit [Sansalvadorimonas verongulae]MTI12641.1 terminase large subunit [Sansalvadorimonas verongulae]